MEIRDGKSYMEQVKQLILEYTDSLGRDLAFQNLEEELEDPLDLRNVRHITTIPWTM